MSVDQQPRHDRLWTARRWPFVTSMLALMTFIAFESFAITTVLPVAMADLDGTRWYSLSYAATLTTALVGMIVGGNWADRSGPRLPLAVGGTLFVVGIAMCGLAPNAAAFVLGRLLQGVGGGIDSVVLYVLIARHIRAELRPRMFGLLTTAWLLPSMIGPVLAGLLTELTNWRVVLGIVLAGAAASLAGLMVVTRDTAPRTRTPRMAIPLFGRPGVLAVVAAGLLLVLHLSGQHPTRQSVIAVPIALVALVVTASRILPPGTLRLRGAPQRLVALRAMLGAVVTASDVYLTFYLQGERGFPPATAGLVIAIGATGWAAGAWIQGRLGGGADTHRLLIRSAAPLVASGPACVLLYTLDLAHLVVVIGACVAMGIGMGIAYPRISSATLSMADESEHGQYSSALQAGENMAAAALLAVSATLLSTVAGTTGFALAYGLLLTGGAIAILIASTQPREVSVEASGA
ncbi:MFS transporter [Plantactinospora sp. GCM10030261]|uniref:MFS transporter n=1 Tax=Plantactinospora sp. GCM10030261 TaxID=3273420 RepID=UPI00361B9FE2